MIGWFERHSLFSFVIAVAIAIAIFYLSSLPFENFKGVYNLNIEAMIYHFTAFFFLAAFLILAVSNKNDYNLIVFVVMFSIFYGITDEFHQMFVQGRFPSFLDVLFDSVGVLFASVVYLGYKNRKA